MGPNQSPIQFTIRALSPGLKRPGREDDHLSLNSAEVYCTRKERNGTMLLVTGFENIKRYKNYEKGKFFLHLGKELVKHIPLSCSDKRKWLYVKKDIACKKILRSNNNAFVNDQEKYLDN
jgi:hypothetical protein